MKSPGKTILFVLLGTAIITGGARLRATSLTEDRATKRILFRVATIEEIVGGGRKVISNATIEGAPGTDFVVDLQSKRFSLSGRFLTDVISPGKLTVRVKLNTRRLYGYSQKDLPLYEEDNQNESLELGFDERMVLLPFGKGGDELLKIEVTPSMSDRPAYLASGLMQPPEIRISEPGPGGAIGIRAFKIPHQFEVEASLLEDGNEVAHGSSPCSIEQPREILLLANDRATSEVIANPLTINLTITGYERNRPVDQAAIRFDVRRTGNQSNEGAGQLVSNWAGIGGLGSALDYDLADHYLKSGKKYELRFRIKLAETETTY